MFNIKQVLLASATFGVVATIGPMSPKFAQAAIVSGNVTGTWDSGVARDVNIGDSFTINYSYDDNIFTSFSSTIPGRYESSIFNWPLISLAITSGSYSHIFDLTTNTFSNAVRLEMETFIADPPGGGRPYSNKLFSVSGGDRSASIGDNVLRTERSTRSYGDVASLPVDVASLRSYDFNRMSVVNAAVANNLQFNPDPTATSVPTPAMLPSLVVVGLTACRRFRSIA
jgi:hypothetical protein